MDGFPTRCCRPDIRAREPSWEPFGVDCGARLWTEMEPRLEIHGSGGWVFESPRARLQVVCPPGPGSCLIRIWSAGGPP